MPYEKYYERNIIIRSTVPVATSKRQIPIRCNGQITDDDTRKVKIIIFFVFY